MFVLSDNFFVHDDIRNSEMKGQSIQVETREKQELMEKNHSTMDITLKY